MRRDSLAAARTPAGLLLAALATAPAAASADAPLREGAYEVAVRLELPNLPDTGTERLVAICVGPEAVDKSLGLAVLSLNNPLASCIKRDIARVRDTLTFQIACEGGNAATGRAVYTLSRESFLGRIAMKMGGKNMTMTETQRGRRTGDCPASR